MPVPRANVKMEMKPVAAVYDGRTRVVRSSAVIDRRYSAFTLIELLVVVVIITILIGLAFPVYQTIQNQAKKTQAKNDMIQIITAVNAFYTEYGRYPTTETTDVNATYGTVNSSAALFNELRGKTAILNTR